MLKYFAYSGFKFLPYADRKATGAIICAMVNKEPWLIDKLAKAENSTVFNHK